MHAATIRWVSQNDKIGEGRPARALRQAHGEAWCGEPRERAETNIAPIRLEDWNRLNSTFKAITGYLMEDVSDTSGDLPERVRRARVAPRFLDVWGIAPVLGRGFTDAEHYAGGPSAVLISERYWRRSFGADPHVLNRIVRLEGESFPIVGVMPASFLFPDREVDLWLPVQMGDKLAQVRYAVWYTGVGRLKPGVTLEQARANLNAIQTELGKQYPKTDAAISVEVVPLKEHTVSGIRSSLLLLFGAVSVPAADYMHQYRRAAIVASRRP